MPKYSVAIIRYVTVEADSQEDAWLRAARMTDEEINAVNPDGPTIDEPYEFDDGEGE